MSQSPSTTLVSDPLKRPTKAPLTFWCDAREFFPLFRRCEALCVGGDDGAGPVRRVASMAWPSLEAMVEDLRWMDGHPQHPRAESNKHDSAFYGDCDSLDEAYDMCRNARKNLSEGLERYRSQYTGLMPRIARRKRSLDVFGSVVDVGSYVSGIPECAYRKRTVVDSSTGKHAARVLRLVYNNGATAAVLTEEHLARGGAFLAAVDALESSGFATELWVAACAGYNAFKDRCYEGLVGRDTVAADPAGIENFPIAMGSPSYAVGSIVQTACCVKRAGEVLDVGRVAFSLCHPSWHRRITFRAREGIVRDGPCGVVGRGFLEGYGRTDYLIDLTFIGDLSDTIVVNVPSQGGASAEKVIEKVKLALRFHGIEEEHAHRN